jgi:cytochrome c oxidase subunit 2
MAHQTLFDSDGPEAPTNRPATTGRIREWVSRPYARAILILTVVIGFILLPLAWLIIAAMNQTGGPASPIMEDIEKTVFWFTIVSIPITAFVFAVLVYSLLGWKQISSDEPPMQESPAIRTNRTGTFMWTAVSSALALFLVVWGMIELASITANSYGSIPADQQPSDEQPLTVNVTGQQWVWTFEYPGYDGATTSVLYLEKDRPVYFNVTSKDVIHNFWAVELGVKIDANPGAVTQTGVTPTKAGVFNVRCAELCGMHHAYMETTIEVLPKETFAAAMREMGGGSTS